MPAIPLAKEALSYFQATLEEELDVFGPLEVPIVD